MKLQYLAKMMDMGTAINTKNPAIEQL